MIGQSVHNRNGEAGFTLLETLVALAVLSMGLAAFYQAVAGGTANEVRIERANIALEVARSRLAAAGIERPLEEGEYRGEDTGVRWIVRTHRYRSASEPAVSSGPIPYMVTAEVDWAGERGRDRSLVLSTIKLGEPR